MAFTGTGFVHCYWHHDSWRWLMVVPQVSDTAYLSVDASFPPQTIMPMETSAVPALRHTYKTTVADTDGT